MLNQKLKLKLSQKLSPQQIQLMKLIQLSTQEFEQRLSREIEENPALDTNNNENLDSDNYDDNENDYEIDESNQDEIDISDYLSDDDIPDYKLKSNNYSEESEKDIPFASGTSFNQFLKAQLHSFSLNKKDQQITRSGFNNIISILTSNGSSIESVSTEGYKKLLENYMSDEEIDQVDDEYKYVESEKLELTTSEFLNQLKLMTINAYKNSEFVGENILAYDPIPNTYYCGDLQELTGGKSWSL